jgi:hypothetical protein
MHLEHMARRALSYSGWQFMNDARTSLEFYVENHGPSPHPITADFLEPLMRDIGCRIGNQYD